MDLQPSSDQQDMIEMVEQFLARELSTAQLRERLRTGHPYPLDAWPQVAELGIFSLGLPEEADGAGCPVVEEALVFRSLGRHLAPVGFLASVLAARLAHLAGEKSLREGIVAGTVRVALAMRPPGVAHALDVIDLPGSEHLLYAAVDAPELVPAVELPPGALVDCLDPSVTLTRFAAGSALAPPGGLAAAGAGEPVRIGLLGTLLAAAMLVGIAEATRDAGVAYAKERVQFGRPIGVNQAIKHPCADAATRAEAAASLLFFAALALRDGRTDAEFQVMAAKRIATRAALDNARLNIQIHGGMGVTWEHDAHLFVTRAHLLDRLFGDTRRQRQVMVRTAAAMP